MSFNLVKTLILMTTVLLSWSASCSDYLMFIGAGGEPTYKQDTMFDDSIKSMSAYTKRNPGIKAEVALDGGHSVTQQIVRNQFSANVKKSDFYETDYKQIIERYKSKLENGEMVSGDQFMIYIDSHGAEKQTQFKTHSIATSASGATNLNTLSGAEVVDLDQLEILKKLAKDKGVKMAIIDASCHSGNTLALADDNTCVISGTGAKHYGYSRFSENFINGMQKGKNLEEIFLETRKVDDTPSLPMISSSAGLAVNSILYDKITPFLYEYSETTDKLTPYLQQNSNEIQMCIANQNFLSLMETINTIEKLNTISRKIFLTTIESKNLDLSHLKNLLLKYKTALDTAALKMRALNIDRLNKIEKISNTFTDGTIWSQDYSWKDILSMDYNKLIGDANTRANREQALDKKAASLGLAAFYAKVKSKKEEILRTNTDLVNIEDKQKDIASAAEATYFTTREIAIEERKLYDALYKKMQLDRPASQSNPCRDFKI